jgi:hypothetical protein
VPALTQAQKRKLSNLFAEARRNDTRCAPRAHLRPPQVTQKQGGVASQRTLLEADVVHVCAAAHLAAAGVTYDDGHELVLAARAWYAFFAKHEHGAAEGLSLRQFLQAATAMLAATEPELPDAITALPALQFKLAAGASGLLSKAEFVAWRLATGRLTAGQLSAATLTDGIGGHEPSLDDVFAGADAGRKKALCADDWARLVERFWRRGEPWDEMNAYSL